ncbi:MAG: hypothetical protein KDJ30_02650 [Rhodoblastus sp.]|nr:hypothetical protein [Rhodoblastus sp.]
MGFYLHLIDDHPVQHLPAEHAPVEHLIDREDVVITVTTVCVAVAVLAQLWQWGAVQALWGMFVGA